MEGAGFAGHPLGDDLGVRVDEDAHSQSPIHVDDGDAPSPVPTSGRSAERRGLLGRILGSPSIASASARLACRRRSSARACRVASTTDRQSTSTSDQSWSQRKRHRLKPGDSRRSSRPSALGSLRTRDESSRSPLLIDVAGNGLRVALRRDDDHAVGRRPSTGSGKHRRRMSAQPKLSELHRSPLHAASSSFTASTETWKLALASSFSSISTIRSTPPAPMMQGTPT